MGTLVVYPRALSLTLYTCPTQYSPLNLWDYFTVK